MVSLSYNERKTKTKSFRCIFMKNELLQLRIPILGCVLRAFYTQTHPS
jgi:hypothetical protein